MKSILSAIHCRTMPLSMAFVILLVWPLQVSSFDASTANKHHSTAVKNAIFESDKNTDNGTISMLGAYSTFRKAKLFGGLNLLFNLSIGRPGTSPDRIIPGIEQGKIRQACNIIQTIKKLVFDLFSPSYTTTVTTFAATTPPPATIRASSVSRQTQPTQRPVQTIRPSGIPLTNFTRF